MSSTTNSTQIPFEPLREKLRETIEKYKANHPEKTDEYKEFKKFLDALESEKTFNTESINEPFCKQYFQYKSQSDGEYDAEYAYRTELKVAQNLNEPFHINEPFYRKYSQYEGKYEDLTWLKLSILLESIELVQCMLDHGANVNSVNKQVYPGYTALHFAVSVGNAEIVQLLINSGADINAQSTHYETPLHLASACGNAEIVHILLTRGAKIIAKDIVGDTPLHYAAGSGNIEVVKLLRNSGADIHAKNTLGYKPLQSAYLYQKPDVAEYLVNCDWLEWTGKYLENIFSKETEHKQENDTVPPSGKEAEQADHNG